MSATLHTPAATRRPIDPMRRSSRAAGILYLITFISIPTLALYNPVRDDADFVLGAGSDTAVLWGALSEVVVALAGVGTAVVLFRVVKRQSETAALGFVASRILEAAVILVGVVSLLSLVSLRRRRGHRRRGPGLAGHDRPHPPGRSTTRHSCCRRASCRSSTRCAWATLMYRSGLVPRILPIIGLVGAPLLLTSDIPIFFGVFDRVVPVRRGSPHPDRRVGVLARRLPDRQGLQARRRRSPPPARRPGSPWLRRHSRSHEGGAIRRSRSASAPRTSSSSWTSTSPRSVRTTSWSACTPPPSTPTTGTSCAATRTSPGSWERWG